MRCLVIEDDADTSRYICNGLTEAGYNVLACDNGLDGLHHAANESWDIVILDRLLPGQVDGLSIVGKLRDLGKNTPVLIVSALTSIAACHGRGRRHAARPDHAAGGRAGPAGDGAELVGEESRARTRPAAGEQ